MKVLGNNVIIEKIQQTETQSGLSLPVSNRKQQGRVVDISHTFRKLLGQDVIYSAQKVLYEDDKIVIVEFEDVIAII